MTSRRRAHTRAFLFADLRGYTAFTERNGDDAASVLLGRYRGLVREQVAAFDGAEIRTEGDSFYVVFESVSDAVNAALAIRDAVSATDDGRGSPIRVGIGVHAGEARDGEQGIVSSAVNIAARVCAVAVPGEVLVTDTVRGLTRTALPVTFEARGRRRMKGIAEPIALFRVTGVVPASTGRWGARGLLLGTGLAAVLVVVIGLAVIRGGTGAAGTPGDTPDEGSVPGGTADAVADETPDLSRFTDQGAYPNAAEQELLDRLPTRIEGSCERAEVGDRPEFHFDDFGIAQTEPLVVRAGLNCLTEGIRVHYWRGGELQPSNPSSSGVAVDLFFNTVRRLGASKGSCDEQQRAYETWDAGLHKGHVLCYVSAAGHATMHWTFDELNVYAIASRRDADVRRVYEWWFDTGIRLGR